MLVLASSSPRRQLLLEMWGYEFERVEVSVSEELLADTGPSPGVRILAERKAQAGYERWLQHAGTPQAVVLGADTLVVLDGEALGKPGNPVAAVAMLQRLSGREHSVLTGVALVGTGKSEAFVVETKVRFRRLAPLEIEHYVASGESLDKAGGYGIQGSAKTFVVSYDGSLTNVVGLPMERVEERLEAWGIGHKVIASREVVDGLPQIEGSPGGDVSP